MKKHNQKTSRRKKADNSLFSYYSFSEEDAKKYPVVSKILKQLTPERIKKEIEAIQKIELPPELQKWVREYEKAGGERDEFIWKWIYKGDRIVTRSFNSSKKYHYSIIETVFLFHMFTNLVDDISEKKEFKNLLYELLKIPFNQNFVRFDQLDAKKKRYTAFTIKVWHRIEKNFRECQYYRKMKYLLEYDVHQLLNTTKYSFLSYNNPYLINKTEYWMYLPQNMQLMIAFDLYLMCRRFNFREIGKIRETILRSQRMLRIGNDIGTWEREIKNNDFASGICVYSLDSEIFSIDDFKKIRKLKIIKKIKNSGIEQEILKEWEKNYEEIKKINEKKGLLNIEKILSMLREITFYHLIGVGYI